MKKQHNHIKWENKSEELYVLNLDEKFDPFENYESGFFKVKYNKGIFPGGEPNFKIESTLYKGDMVITQRVNSIENLMDIVIVNDAVRRMGIENIELFIPYFPAARQDRICNVGEAFTLKIFADIINSCNFSKVTILCPHSDVTPALINNVVVLDGHQYLPECVDTISNGDVHINIVCPDAGAGKRVQKAIEYLSNEYGYNKKYHLIRCEKIRNVKDGSLQEFFVGDILYPNAPFLILDDINCKGGTFIGLADKIREKSSGRISLFTVHSDCQEGVENVLKNFDYVFTTDSKHTWTDFLKFDRLTCFKIEYK